MATNIIDALVVTFGLDTKEFEKGQKSVAEGQKKTRDDAEKTAKFMQEQGKTAAGFFSSIKNELLALAGVTLSLHGLTTFVKNMTGGLLQVSIQSQAIGISAKALDGWQKSAEAAGSSAEKITGTLTTFQNAIQAFRSGDASSPLFKTLAMLNGDTGIEFNPRTDDADATMRKVAQALQAEKNPDRARYLGQQLGLDDATLQNIRSGQFVKNADTYQSSSGITAQDIENARQFNVQWTTLQQGLENTGYILFNALSPYIKTFNDYLLDIAVWMTEHPKEMHDAVDSISTAIKNFVPDVNDAITSIEKFGKILTKITDFLNDPFGIDKVKKLGEETGANNVAKKFPAPTWDQIVGWFTGKTSSDDGNTPATSGNPSTPGQTNSLSFIDRLEDWRKSHIPGIVTPQNSNGDNNQYVSGGLKKIINDAADKISASFKQTIDIPYLGPTATTSSMNVSLNPNEQGQYAKASQPTSAGRQLLNMMSATFGNLEAKYGLPVGLLRSVATTESGGDPNAVSKAGAKGLFQFMDGTAHDMGLAGTDVYNPNKSAEAAAKYLAYLLRATHGNEQEAIAAYNEGLGNLQRRGLANSPVETLNYVPKVLAGMNVGSNAYASQYPQSGTSNAQSGPVYNINGVEVNSNPATVIQLTDDLKAQAANRTRVLAYNTGQE